MMNYLPSLIFAILLTNNFLCQNNTVKIIFETTQIDSATKLNEPQVYILKKITENSDFDYSKLDSIDSFVFDTLSVKNLMPIFEPINGKYNYYQFISTFEGEAYVPDEEANEEEYLKKFHEILIIKTDNDNKIIDAFQYTLEWSEPPLQFDLFKSSSKNVVLKNNLEIKNLQFVRSGFEDKYLTQNGIIKLK